MGIVIWVINLLGIGISAFGTYILFKGTPLDSLGFGSSTDNSVIFPDQYEKLYRDMMNRRVNSMRGLKFLMAGFLLQGIAQLFALFPLLNS
ncbi:hypothetical protein [Paenibacillus brevis]|uniref:Uncharacterized protein n=1 Tax=Paenibacillus brevis TaxID=2841508 RepID=A0ABS6FV22_9BACL|nr:hypothetical protein [Paenibacillus brevis]MBU5673228.1 hypothetical protein [Paenibacillus brevis]